MTFRQMIDAVLIEHGFDLGEPTAKAWLNERYTTAVVRARWRLAELEVGVTVAGHSDYPLDATINELAFVYIGASGEPYIEASPVEMRRIIAGTNRVDGAAGAFSQAFDANGNPVLRLTPVPATDGQTITGLVAKAPAALVDDTDEPAVPADIHKPITDGAIAIGLERDAERLQEAAYFTQSFETGVRELERRGKRRISGGGPSTIRRGW